LSFITTAATTTLSVSRRCLVLYYAAQSRHKVHNSAPISANVSLFMNLQS